MELAVPDETDLGRYMFSLMLKIKPDFKKFQFLVYASPEHSWQSWGQGEIALISSYSDNIM